MPVNCKLEGGLVILTFLGDKRQLGSKYSRIIQMQVFAEHRLAAQLDKRLDAFLV